MSPVTSPVTFHEVIKVSIVTRGNDVSGISVNSKSVAGKAFFSLSLRYPVLLCLYSSGWTWRRTHKTSSIWLQGCLQRLHSVVGKGKRPWQSRGGFCTSCVHGTPEFCTCGISQFVPQASGAVCLSKTRDCHWLQIQLWQRCCSSSIQTLCKLTFNSESESFG